MFESTRCSINTLQNSDYAEVKSLYVNSEVRKYLGGIRHDDEMEAVFSEMLYADEDSFYWIVREKHTGDFIGLVSIDPHHDGICHEISYQLLPNWWGKGYATEVVQFIIHYVLYELNHFKVVAETQTANIYSCKLLERVGMKLERTVIRFGAEQAIYAKTRPI
ncbi:N-acetyltransferase [Oceanobacillus piezotolerans]|uniref:N-acetyltransferase n=1 Tax=Oceanobacillus piezotolerans TaxID=2448030 RepID=A0A498DFM0_9BACI|nr:GNAT family N-acetyltransferase [Oceanobacillus piezotolerans]RLL48335.1 N-acetyltransferase [Oceanobacillus piezotolerans]